MKRIFIIIPRHLSGLVFLITLSLQAQVGVNTTNPESIFDVSSSSQVAPTNTDGLLIPPIDAFPLTSPTSLQDGMLVFFTGNAIQAKGFYYWDDTLDIWVFYGGVNRIHQLNDGRSYFVNTTDTGINVTLGETEEVYNTSISHNTAVGYKSQSPYSNFSYSYATSVGYNASSSDNRSLFLEESTVFGYHDINTSLVDQRINNSFAHLIKSQDVSNSSLAIGHAYGNTSYDITSNGSGISGRAETYIGSYSGNVFDVYSDSGMLYYFRLTTLGFDYETLPNEPLNSSKLFYDSGNDILQCRAKDVLRGIHYDVGAGGSNRDQRFTISLGYRELYAFNMKPNVFKIHQNISLGYLAHDNLSYVTNQNDEYINNLAIGSYAMYSSETVGNSIAIGENALRLNTGDENIAIGKDAMNQHDIGDGNTVLGSDALHNNLLGANNVALGSASGFNVVGSENTLIGRSASSGASSHFKNGGVNIGDFSGNSDTNFNRLYIENSSGTTPLIGGNFSSNRVGVNRNIANLTNTFEVGGTASKSAAGNWFSNSDGRLKKSILHISGISALKRITKLNGVSYFWNDTQTGNTRPESIQYGFIAQDLMQVFPEHVTKDNQGYYQTAYGTYDAFVVEAIKELQTKFDENNIEIKALDARFSRIENLLLKRKAELSIVK